MTDKHPNAGVEAAIKVVERRLRCLNTAHLVSSDKRPIGQPCRCANCITYRLLRALPAQQPDVSALVEALEGIDPYLDQLVCYASTTQEYQPNAAVKRVRDALQSQQKPQTLPSIEGAHGGQKAEA